MDDRWYQNGVLLDSGGVRLYLNPESMFYCGTVLAALRFLADAYAVCPPIVGRRLESGGRELLPRHRAQRLLRNPNAWQTGFEHRHLMMIWVASWGNAYNRIVGRFDNASAELRPIHPSRVKVLGQDSEGNVLYEYRPEHGVPETLDASEILHYRGISFDGVEGAPMYKLIQNVVRIALLVEQHIGTQLQKGTRLSGLLSAEAPMEKEARDSAREAWNAQVGGSSNSGGTAFVPFGVKFTPVSMNNKDAQLVEMSDKSVEAILRFLGVPGMVVGYQGDKASTYASAKEFFQSGGIKHCVLPRVTAMEQREAKTLLLEAEQDDYFVKHNMDALLRADTPERFSALVQASGGPFLTENEARAIEDLNPDPDPSANRVLRPSNMTVDIAEQEKPETPAEQPRRRPSRPAPPDEDEGNEALALGWQFALDAAARIVRREIAALKGSSGKLGLALRYASDPDGWRAAVSDYYEKHALTVADMLHITEEQARAYAGGQRDAVLADGVSAIETWEQTVPPKLAALAYGE